MKKTLLTLLLLCSLVACEGKRPELVDPDVVMRDGIAYLARSTEPLTADVVRWYENGQLLEQYTMIDGKKEGLSRWWWENGQLATEDNYANGKKEGLSRSWYYESGDSWYESGQLVYEENYVNGKKVD